MVCSTNGVESSEDFLGSVGRKPHASPQARRVVGDYGFCGAEAGKCEANGIALLSGDVEHRGALLQELTTLFARRGGSRGCSPYRSAARGGLRATWRGAAAAAMCRPPRRRAS